MLEIICQSAIDLTFAKFARHYASMKAREWLERGMNTMDPVDAFACFWRGFNNLFSSIGKGQERELIRTFLSNKLTGVQAHEILVSNAESVEYLLSQPVIDMRRNGKDSTPHIHAFNTATDPQTKVQELFMIIYQVRCNLEHGQKSPTNERDIQLCKCAAPIIGHVIERQASNL